MITRIKLQNWKSHENSELEFCKGTNVLVGIIGSGKSSVLDGISFALFGTFPALQSKRIRLDECIMNKPEQKDNATVELSLNLNGNGYTIRREIKKGKGSKAELRENGRLLEGPNAHRVNEALQNILKVDYELFSRAVYSEQNQIDYFLQIPAGQRKKKIDELLCIERFENARKNVITVINRLKDKRMDREKELGGVDEKELQELVASLDKEISSLEEENEKRIEVLEERKNEYRKLEELVDDLENKQRKAREIENRINSLKGEIENYERNMVEIQEKLGKLIEEDMKKHVENARAKLNEIKNRLLVIEKSRLQQEFSELKSEEDFLEKRERELERKLEERKELEEELKELEGKGLENELSKKKSLLEDLDKRIVELETKVGEEKERIEDLERSEEKCPVCESRITKIKRKELIEKSKLFIEKSKQKLRDLIEKRKEISLEEIEQAIRRKDLLNDRIEELKPLDKEIEEKRARMKHVKKELKEREKVLEDEKKEKKELEDKKDLCLQEISKLERTVEKQKEYFNAMKSKELAENEMSRLEKAMPLFDEYDLMNKRKEKEKIGMIVKELSVKLDSTREIINEKRKNLDRLNERIDEIEDWKDELDFLKNTIHSFDIFSSSLEVTQSQLREEFTNTVNAGLEDIWPRIYPYGDYTGVRLGVEEGDYVLQVRSRVGWINVEGIASGGERSIACLALRIAFSLVLTQNLSWLVLDEPTHNLDSKAIAELSKTLKEHLPSLVDQIFIITHDEELEAAVSGMLYRLERDKSKDEPTKISLVSSGMS